MTNEVIWLIVVAFFFSRGFVKTGLGDRVATCFIKWMGRRTVGLAYGLVLSEALICPAIPSSTARAGGVFSPVIKSVAVNNGSMPFDNKSGKKIGSYLVMAQLQVCVYVVVTFLVLSLVECIGNECHSAKTTYVTLFDEVEMFWIRDVFMFEIVV